MEEVHYNEERKDGVTAAVKEAESLRLLGFMVMIALPLTSPLPYQSHNVVPFALSSSSYQSVPTTTIIIIIS